MYNSILKALTTLFFLPNLNFKIHIIMVYIYISKNNNMANAICNKIHNISSVKKRGKRKTRLSESVSSFFLLKRTYYITT